MRIGIYVDVAKEEQPRGIGFHILHLLKGLSAVDGTNEYFLYYREDLWGKSHGFPHCPDEANFRSRPVRFPRNWDSNHPSLWWKHYLPRVVAKDRIDVFHGPNHFLPVLPHRRTVVTVHDVAYFKMELYTPGVTALLREWTRRALEQAGAVIAISQNTQRDVEELGVEPSRIRLIYGGGNVANEDEIQYDRRDELRRQFQLPEKYILFVGTIHPRKNVPFLLRSFHKLKREKGLPHKLVLAGKPDAAANDVQELIRELQLEGDTIITGYVEDWHIPLLYKMADVFVLPTLYEGFTLVTLEAMSYGTPVISTDTSSIREGVGDAGLLVPVNDVDALAKAIEDVLFQPGLAAEMVAKGHEQARKFSWRKCAEQTCHLYEELGGSRRGASPAPDRTAVAR